MQKLLILNPEKCCFSLIDSKVRTRPIFVTKTLHIVFSIIVCYLIRTKQETSNLIENTCLHLY